MTISNSPGAQNFSVSPGRPEGLRKRIKAMATARGLQDSQMVEELLWLALAMAAAEDRP
jgi:hypothetical protein